MKDNAIIQVLGYQTLHARLHGGTAYCLVGSYEREEQQQYTEVHLQNIAICLL